MRERRMPDGKETSSTITIRIPPSYWTQGSAEASKFIDAFVAAMCEDGATVGRGVQKELDLVKENPAFISRYQKEAREYLREGAVPDFKEIDEVPEGSPLRHYAVELERGCGYNLVNIAPYLKGTITKVQQIRDFLASQGMVDRGEQNIIMTVIHQSLLWLPGYMGSFFILIMNLYRLGGANPGAYNNSLLNYDPDRHIATLRFEQELGPGCMGVATYTVDLLQRTIATDMEVTLPKDKLSSFAKKSLRKFEGEDPDHFIFGVVSKTPSWRDTLFASIRELEMKEKRIDEIISRGACNQQLKTKASDLLREISSLRQTVYNIFCDGREGLVKMELFKNAQNYLTVLHQVADMEIRCLEGNKLPPPHELHQLQKQLEQLSLQPKSVGRKIKNAFRKIATAFGGFLHALFNVFRKTQVIAEETQTKVFCSLRKRLRTGAEALVEYAGKGLCLYAMGTSSRPGTLVTGDAGLQALPKSEQKEEQPAVEPAAFKA
jgi:hypothetical protein